MTHTTEPSKISGKSDQVVGSIKSTIGSVLNNKEMQAKGDAQHYSGESEVQAAAAKQKAEAVGDGLKGNVKDAVGSITGNDKLRTEGKADKNIGDVKSRTA